MIRRPPTRRSLFAALASLAAFSCSPKAPLPSPPAQVDVNMREYRFDHRPRVAQGRIVFRARNAGRLPHQLVLLPTSARVRGPEPLLGAPGATAAIPLAILPDLTPGESGTFAQDLRPGRYAVVCLLQDPDGTSHFRRGMRSELEVF